MKKMTPKDREELRLSLEEGVALHLYHDYEDEDDFTAKFGKTDTLEEAVELYRKHSYKEDLIMVCRSWIRDFPGSKEELLDLFGLEAEEVGV